MKYPGIVSLFALFCVLTILATGCDREERRAVPAEALLGALQDGLNNRSVEAVAPLFHEGFRGEQPAHQGQTFEGREQVEAYWNRLFSALPNFRAELVRSTIEGNEIWSEWEWSGTDARGTPHLYRGVIVFGVEEGRFAWSRMYMEPVDVRESENS